MNDAFFQLRIVTPLKITEKQIQHIRLKDKTGFFGIMRGHIDFLTVLEPSLCYFIGIDGNENFLAVNGGIVSVRGGKVTITSPEVFESKEAEELSNIIQTTIVEREKSDMGIHKTLEGIERSFLEKSIEVARGS